MTDPKIQSRLLLICHCYEPNEEYEGGAISDTIDPSIRDLDICSLTARGMSVWIADVREPSSDKDTPRSYLVLDDKG